MFLCLPKRHPFMCRLRRRLKSMFSLRPKRIITAPSKRMADGFVMRMERIAIFKNGTIAVMEEETITAIAIMTGIGTGTNSEEAGGRAVRM